MLRKSVLMGSFNSERHKNIVLGTMSSTFVYEISCPAMKCQVITNAKENVQF